MANEISPPRLIIEEEVHIWAGETATRDAIAAVGDEPLPEDPKGTLDKIRQCHAYKDPRHKDHQLALDQERRLVFGIVAARDKAAEAEAADAEKPITEEQLAAFSDGDLRDIELGAAALGGTAEGTAAIQVVAENDVDALRQLMEIGQAERDGFPVVEALRQHGHLLPAEAKRAIDEQMTDEKFQAAYYDNGHFGHQRAVAEAKILHSIAAGEITRWQQQQQQPQ